jgi:hypothetical protein
MEEFAVRALIGLLFMLILIVGSIASQVVTDRSARTAISAARVPAIVWYAYFLVFDVMSWTTS